MALIVLNMCTFIPKPITINCCQIIAILNLTHYVQILNRFARQQNYAGFNENDAHNSDKLIEIPTLSCHRFTDSRKLKKKTKTKT